MTSKFLSLCLRNTLLSQVSDDLYMLYFDRLGNLHADLGNLHPEKNVSNHCRRRGDSLNPERIV